MKKLFVMLALLVVVSTSFAGETKAPIKVDFYGVDFSEVVVTGAVEECDKFIKVFEGINNLLVVEAKKYNVGEFLKVNVASIDCKVALERIEALQNVDFKDKPVPTIDLKKILSFYPTTENYGLVIVAKELNKTSDKGTFVAVIYDGKSKEIVSTYELSGKSKGFGLRNYWAGSLYNGLVRAKVK
ncbi:MAG: hypothetical protein ACRCZY_02155 [Phocaeicola sp.]